MSRTRAHEAGTDEEETTMLQRRLFLGRLFLAAACATAIAAGSGPAVAQTFPNKPITLIVRQPQAVPPIPSPGLWLNP